MTKIFTIKNIKERNRKLLMKEQESLYYQIEGLEKKLAVVQRKLIRKIYTIDSDGSTWQEILSRLAKK